MDIFWFRDLGHLARTGHFSQAAEMSHISQSAFSRRIMALETWVGVPLVDRARHPVKLTAAGAQMLKAGQQALARLETERAQIIEENSSPESYVVTFGAPHSIGWRFFPAWLQAFEGAFGPIISRMRAEDLPACIEALKRHEIDFLIAYASAYASGVEDVAKIESLRIGRDALIPVSKPRDDGTPLHDLRRSSPAVIPLLRFGDTAPISQHVEPLLAAYDLRHRLETVYENSMAGALRIRAREGQGIAWLPRSIVAPDLENGLLTRTGDPAWETALEVRLHRLRAKSNKLTRAIWTYLAVREGVPLLAQN